MTKRKKIVLVISLGMLACILAAVIILSMTLVVCENDTEVWALPPRKTIDNVVLNLAMPGEKYQFLGTYTDIKGVKWYIVSGVIEHQIDAGQDIGFIEQSKCKLAFGW